MEHSITISSYHPEQSQYYQQPMDQIRGKQGGVPADLVRDNAAVGHHQNQEEEKKWSMKDFLLEATGNDLAESIVPAQVHDEQFTLHLPQSQ